MKPRMTDVVFPPTFETTASFTPGPWKYIPSHIAEGPSEVRHADGWLICCTCSDEFARLIAAAPELLAVATKLDEFWTAEFPGGPDGSAEVWGGIAGLSDETLGIWRQARAAIAAAKAGA